MGLVIEGLSALCVILLLFWLLSLRGSVAGDRAAAAQLAAREKQAKEQAARDARLHRKGETLRCLGCDRTFSGPLPDTGCPHCHLAALVVSEYDYRQGKKAAQANKQPEKEDS